MHYRVYYALYLFENESCNTAEQLSNAYNHAKGGQQTIMKYGYVPPTHFYSSSVTFMIDLTQ